MLKKFFFPLLLCALPLSAAHAGAWLQPAHQGLFLTQVTYLQSNEYYDDGGHRHAQSHYRKYELQPYLEYGVSDRLTVGGTAFLQRDSQAGNVNQGIADPELFLRTPLWQDARQILSLQPLLKLESRFDDSGAPRGGTSSTDAELSLLYGRNLNLFGPHDYLDLRGGYRYRDGALHDQIQADAALGLELTPSVQLVPAIRTTTATKLSHSATFSENGDQDYDLVRLELGAHYRPTPTRDVGLTLFDHVSGRQSGDGIGATVSFAQHF